MKRKILRLLFSRRTLVFLLLLVQAAVSAFFLFNAAQEYNIIRDITSIFSIILVFYVLNRTEKPAYKLIWIIFILVSPLFGSVMYVIFRIQSSAVRNEKRFSRYGGKRMELLVQDEDTLRLAGEKNADIEYRARYLLESSGFPLYAGCSSYYLSSGESFFNMLCDELEKAEKFIFLEYFIISPGEMWDRIHEILLRKVDEGLDVRVIYDDLACMANLPAKYYKSLDAEGIKCLPFHPFRPLWTTMQNNRDHRKIAIIDGNTAFTGGANLADEYINKLERFGRWKDSCVCVKGDAVSSFVVMFLDMWDSVRKSEEEFAAFLPIVDTVPDEVKTADEGSGYVSLNTRNTDKNSDFCGFVQPFSDSPTDDEYTGEQMYLQLINSAKKYIYVTTPYLILDDILINALILAAKSGVDVRIITPRIPDKKLVHICTRASYMQLIKGGVKIYEYLPGFMHSKLMVCDGHSAFIGSLNLDYRSLFLHFECGVCLYDTGSIADMEKDILLTLEECEQISAEFCSSLPLRHRLCQKVLKLVAPLL